MESRTIRHIPDFEGVGGDAICFETLARPDEVRNPDNWAFEHRGPGFSPLHDPSSVESFADQILLGRTMPPEMIVRSVSRPTVVTAALLFEAPRRLLMPETRRVVRAVGEVARYGDAFAAHQSWEHRTLLRGLRRIVRKAEEPVRRGVETISAWLDDGTLPDVEPPPSPEDIEETGDLLAFRGPPESWLAVWNRGFTAGVRFDGDSIEIMRKSPFSDAFEPRGVAERLREIDDAEWECDENAARAEDSTLEWSDVSEVLNG